MLCFTFLLSLLPLISPISYTAILHLALCLRCLLCLSNWKWKWMSLPPILRTHVFIIITIIIQMNPINHTSHACFLFSFVIDRFSFLGFSGVGLLDYSQVCIRIIHSFIYHISFPLNKYELLGRLERQRIGYFSICVYYK